MAYNLVLIFDRKYPLDVEEDLNGPKNTMNCCGMQLPLSERVVEASLAVYNGNLSKQSFLLCVETTCELDIRNISSSQVQRCTWIVWSKHGTVFGKHTRVDQNFQMRTLPKLKGATSLLTSNFCGSIWTSAACECPAPISNEKLTKFL